MRVQVVRQSDSDKVTVIGACVTLVEAFKAADELAKAGVNIRIIDPFTIKPIDAETIISSARKTGGRIITVEDHYSEGEHHVCVCVASPVQDPWRDHHHSVVGVLSKCDLLVPTGPVLTS